jgi:hypothetical protein
VTTPRLVDRVGLGATGLPAITPRDIRSWLDRARAGGLDPAEAAATTRIVFRVWLVAFLLKALGSGWDVAWHFRWLRDDFAPPHNVNLVGDGIAIVLVVCHAYTRFAVDKVALRLMVGGAALFVVSAPIDVVNHRINGLDITSWSITHFGLYTGTGILLAGVIRAWRLHSQDQPRRLLILGGLWFFFLENVWFPAQHQEYGVREIASWDAGHPYAEPSLLAFAANQIGRPVDRAAVVHFALPVAAWVYPLWIATAAALTLLAARRSVGWRWTATTLAAAYLGWRCVLWPFFAATGFPHSAVPYAIVAVGLAVDLACLLELGWLPEAVVGAVLVTAATYLALYVQARAADAPPISYSSAFVAAPILAAGWAVLANLRTRRSLTLF